MALIGLALLGVAVGAAGTEILRARNPELVEKVEESARRLVERFFPSKTDDEETKE